MNTFLEEASAILDDFEKEIAAKKKIWEQLAQDNPGLAEAQADHWQKKCDRIWLYGATDTLECNDLSYSSYKMPPSSDTANSSAQKIHAKWRKWLDTAGIPKWNTRYDYDKKTHQYLEVQSQEQGEMYYANDDKFEIQEPYDEETLLAFMIRLGQEFEKSGKGHRLEWRALRSFLGFLRHHYSKEEVAFIEHIFPQKMALRQNQIIRLIPSEAYPIPEGTAAAIIMELAFRCRNGRPDARHTAAESLALCWLCVSGSKVRLPKHLEMVRKIKAEEMQPDGGFFFLQLPTWFGKVPVRISKRAFAFLKAVSLIPSKNPRETILQRPARSLTRLFDDVVQSVNPPSKYGNITYLSLLSQPHPFENHRYQPKS